MASSLYLPDNEVVSFKAQEQFKAAQKRAMLAKRREGCSKSNFSVWVGAEEVNDYLMTYDVAYDLAMEYANDGYDDVIIENHKDGTYTIVTETIR